jgi:hypothetical protein
MGNTCLADRRLRLTPLVGCLAATLALASGAAEATRAPHLLASAGLLDRARTGDPPEKPSWWKRPDPADIALRWQPVPREIPSVPANSIVVQNCNDSGSGSLRDAVDNANSGDTIDLTQLSCSTITLTTGSLVLTQEQITLQGRGSKYLSIDGNDTYPPLLHSGTGALYINDLTIEHGMKYFTGAQTSDADGGCIYSHGAVFVTSSVVEYCTAKNTGTYGAKGGAVFGYGGVSLSNSSVINSSAIATMSYESAAGGGIYSRGFVDIIDSFVGGNYASRDGGGVLAFGGLSVKYSTIDSNNSGGASGGLEAFGNITIGNSTISNNQAVDKQGGAFLYAYMATLPISIVSSTISGNSATTNGGVEIDTYYGVYGSSVANSTIAFNYEGTTTKYGSGLYVSGTVDLESTIVGNNTYAGGTEPDDAGGGSSSTITGAGNLIGYSAIPSPHGTILLESPRLGALAFNGGTTKTHMLLSGSPAIDVGNAASGVSFDQRGSGYPRVIGSSADIGAYELDTDDLIFANGFDP